MTNLDLITPKLPYRFLKITGQDSAKFLQGQISSDVDALESNKVQFGTANTPKGRMYGLFLIAKIENGFLLRIHESTFDTVLSTLNKYAVFFKCDLIESIEYLAYGTRLANESDNQRFSRIVDLEETIDDSIIFFADSTSSRAECWLCNTVTLEDRIVIDDKSSQTTEKWLAQDCIEGLPELYSETTEAFVLQSFNLDKLGGVSFKKGCYTGQEIIARMKYLGKVKKRAQIISISTDSEEHLASPGTTILNEEQKTIGQLVRLHRLDSRKLVGLAVLPVEDCPVQFTLANDLTAELYSAP